MQHVVNTPAQTRALLRTLRQARGLSQAQLGARLGVNQKRVARIEAAPHVTSFDQIVRAIVALGGRVLIDDGLELQAVPKAPHAAAKPGKRPGAGRGSGPSREPTW